MRSTVVWATLAVLLAGFGHGSGRAAAARTSRTARAPGPRVVSVTPTGTLQSGISLVEVTFDANIDPATVNSSTVFLTEAGPDGLRGTADDLLCSPLLITTGASDVRLGFAGIDLPDGLYRLRVRGTPSAIPDETNRWSLDEGAGATTQDAVGGATGTLEGAATPAWTSFGRLGSALQFGGGDGRVLISAQDLPPPWTASLWVRREDSSAEDARLLDGPGASLRLEQFNHTNRVGLTTPGNDFAYLYQAPTNNWVHLTFANDGTVTSLYVDGVYAQSVGLVPGCPRTALGSTGLNSLLGRLDEVRLFSRRLSETEIRSLAALGAVRGMGGNPIDGENGGTLPSGDGNEGGDFVHDFDLITPVPTLAVAGMNPAPGSSQFPTPTFIAVNFNEILDPVSVNASSVRVKRAGPDMTIDTADDVPVVPSLIDNPTPSAILRIWLPPTAVGDIYHVTVSGTTAEPAGLIHRWSFDEGTGLTTADAAGGATGTLGGNGGGVPVWASGRLGPGLRFSGVKDRVRIGGPTLPVPWTAGLWVRREGATAEDARLMDSVASSLRLEQYNSPGQLGVTIGGVTDETFSVSAPTGIWCHLTFVGEASGTSLYFNGSFQQKLPVSLGAPRAALGSDTYNSMAGELDEVRMFGRALAPDEIRGMASLGGAVRSRRTLVLDGEFTGAFPSGNGAPGGDFVATFTVTGLPPGGFDLLTPASNATGVSLTPTFTWEASIGAQQYALQVATDPGFASLVVDLPGILTTSSTPAVTLASATPYYWRVTAVNVGGTFTGVGSPAAFTTIAPPGAFSLTTPAAGAAGVSTSPTYAWTASPGAASYTLQVSTDPGFGSFVVHQAGLAGTSATPATALAGGTLYHWRVTAVNGAGPTLATGAPASFTTAVPPPGAFALSSPADGDGDVPIQPVFAWTASSDAATYRLEVSTDAGFAAGTQVIIGLTATSYGSLQLAENVLYHWRVSAENASGMVTTGARSFRTSAGLSVGGGCGLTGLEALALLAALRSAGRRRARARTSCRPGRRRR
jgi:hypothetical protein